jgi:hypothetical protein
MTWRVITTVILLMLALYAFWGNALDAGAVNPFGILFLFFAAMAWFKWAIIRDGFAVAKGESQTPIIRLSANMIGGMANMFRGSQDHRRPPSSNA